MHLQTVSFGESLVVSVGGHRIDAACAIQFKDLFRAAVSGSTGRVVLDLSSVTFVDSSGLGAIVAAMKVLGPERRLELAGVTGTVAKVFRLTRMDSVFRMHSNRSEADKSLAEAS